VTSSSTPDGDGARPTATRRGGTKKERLERGPAVLVEREKKNTNSAIADETHKHPASKN